MRKILLLFVLLYSLLGYNQSCTVDATALNAYIAPSAWGIMPDTVDNLPPGRISEQYDTFLQFKLPQYADELDSTLPHIQLASLQLINITGLPSGFTFTSSSSTTDSIYCNTADCKWAGGATGCMRIIGTPTVTGTFPLVITLEGKTIGGPLAQTGTGDINGYKLNVNPVSIKKVEAPLLQINQNSPNPFSQITKINYTLTKNSAVKFRVMNILGEIVYKNDYQGKQGENKILFDGSSYNQGVYFYTIESNGVTLTKRMIIEK